MTGPNPVLDIDFTKGPPDTRLWTPESRKITGSIAMPENVRARSDGLHLVADARFGRGAQLTTRGKWSQTYGRFEVTAIVPQPTAPGFQTTFWLYPDNDLEYGWPWPKSGEIDFAEFYSLYPSLVIPVVHLPTTVDNYTKPQQYANNQAHVFGCRWIPGEISFYIDHNPPYLSCEYQPVLVQRPAPFDRPFNLNLTQTVGEGKNQPGAHTPQTSEIVVTRIQVWK